MKITRRVIISGVIVILTFASIPNVGWTSGSYLRPLANGEGKLGRVNTASADTSPIGPYDLSRMSVSQRPRLRNRLKNVFLSTCRHFGIRITVEPSSIDETIDTILVELTEPVTASELVEHLMEFVPKTAPSRATIRREVEQKANEILDICVLTANFNARYTNFRGGDIIERCDIKFRKQAKNRAEYIRYYEACMGFVNAFIGVVCRSSLNDMLAPRDLYVESISYGERLASVSAIDISNYKLTMRTLQIEPSYTPGGTDMLEVNRNSEFDRRLNVAYEIFFGMMGKSQTPEELDRWIVTLRSIRDKHNRKFKDDKEVLYWVCIAPTLVKYTDVSKFVEDSYNRIVQRAFLESLISMRVNRSASPGEWFAILANRVETITIQMIEKNWQRIKTETAAAI